MPIHSSSFRFLSPHAAVDGVTVGNRSLRQGFVLRQTSCTVAMLVRHVIDPCCGKGFVTFAAWTRIKLKDFSL